MRISGGVVCRRYAAYMIGLASPTSHSRTDVSRENEKVDSRPAQIDNPSTATDTTMFVSFLREC